MSDYTKSTNFATKDNLTPGDPLKIVRGTEIDTEFNNIAIAIATKTDNASAAITGGSITGITDLAIADGGTGASTANAALNNLLPSQTGNANKYLQTDGTNTSWDAVSLSTSDITGTLPVANGGTGVTSSTGTGSVVLSNSPTLVTPALGTPASGVATNLTGLPLTTGVTGTLPIANGGTGQTTANAAFNALAPSQATASGKYLKSDGTNTSWDALDISTADITGTLPVANGGTGVTTSTGTGNVVLSTSPTLVTPALGTPSSATLTNATGLPISTGVSGLGTGVATALAVNTGSSGAVVVNGGALGTPSSGTVTNLTGTASININGTVGATTPTTGAFTTTTVSTSETLSYGTANGVTYLNGSKVLTSGSALTFDGSQLAITPASGNAVTKLFGPTGSGVGAYFSVYAQGANCGYFGSDSGIVGSGTSNDLSIYPAGSNNVRFYQGGSEQMRLTSTGLGIGTSSPATKLQVVGEIRSSSDISNSSDAVVYSYSGGSAGSVRSGIQMIGSSQEFRIYTAGSARAYVDSSGNLGLGVTPSASTLATIQSTYGILVGNSQANILCNAYYSGGWKYIAAATATQYQQASGEHRWMNAASGTAGTAISFTQAMTLAASGKLSLGTTSAPSGNSIQAVISNSSGGGIQLDQSGSGGAFIPNGGSAGVQIYTYTGGVGSESYTERARIDSSGNLLVGDTTSGTVRLRVTNSSSDDIALFKNSNATPYGVNVSFSGASPNNTSSYFYTCADSGPTTRFKVYSNGGIANYSANNVNLSDQRVKTDIQDAGGYLAKICAIPVRTFKYKDQTDDLLNLGVIAQEVEAVAPELVDTTGFGETPEDGVPLKAIYQTDLQYALMKCIQEQQAIITQLQARLDAANL